MQYYPYAEHLKKHFGQKTYKVIVASGFTCPTRDGLLGKGGCAFCDVRGSSSFFGKQDRGKGVREQLRKKIPALEKRFQAKGFLAYFQSYTNTYGTLQEAQALYEEALQEPGIQGLCIGTRPDCLPDEILELLNQLSQKTYISLELGIQSFEDPTLLWLKRGHLHTCSLDALKRLRQKAPRVHICAHLIFGSPTDSSQVAPHAANFLNEYQVSGVKLHQLMILKHTELAQRLQEQPFALPSLEAYAAQVAQFIEHLHPSIYLERLCATATHQEECIAPAWSKDRWKPHNVIRDFLKKQNCIQGSQLSRETRIEMK
jgi:hypothetical protein